MVKSLRVKIESGTFQTLTVSRQRQQYWYRGFLKQANRLRNVFGDGMKALMELLSDGVIVATHSLKYFEKIIWKEPPHLIFALTPFRDTV